MLAVPAPAPEAGHRGRRAPALARTGQSTTGALRPRATGGAAMNGTNMLTRKVLLGCGIVPPLLYVATTILGALRWEGYSSTSQTASELFAIDAPSRPLV